MKRKYFCAIQDKVRDPVQKRPKQVLVSSDNAKHRILFEKCLETPVSCHGNQKNTDLKLVLNVDYILDVLKRKEEESVEYRP
jgi:hypothetical protein